jgi:hypothetical protein
MNSGLASTLSDFTKRSEFAKNPLAADATDEAAPQAATPGLLTRMRGWFDKLISAAALRTVLAFVVGIAATLAWQSYGNAARTTIAGWSPRLAWLAPASMAVGASREQIKATTLALTSVRQSVDKLATEVGRLEAQSSASSNSNGAAAASPSRRGSRH